MIHLAPAEDFIFQRWPPQYTLSHVFLYNETQHSSHQVVWLRSLPIEPGWTSVSALINIIQLQVMPYDFQR